MGRDRTCPKIKKTIDITNLLPPSLPPPPSPLSPSLPLLSSLPLPTLLAARALIQFPSASNDLLILAPSLILAPLLVVTVALSEPARSMRLSFPWVTSAVKPPDLAL